MQLARSFWLDQDKNWKRKLNEVMIAAELERRFSKEEILQLYANEVYLGRRGSFSIHGFGEAAHAYFGKDVRDLTIPEAATLAGIIQRPSYYNPFRYPERVKERRNLVLTLMHNNGYLTAAQAEAAKAEPIALKALESESSEAPYFVDMVNNELQEQFQDWDFNNNAYRIYSTLDVDLQHAAGEAIRVGLAPLLKRFGRKKKEPANLPQVALVCLDAHTGAIKALVGGRNYAESQLNRVFAKRQPGSTFKPFVYAAALDATARGNPANITAGSTFLDEPTTFTFNHRLYEPANFGDEYLGTVTVRKALTHSLNIPTIKVAEKIGFQPVVELAKAAGITSPLQATPSIALGSYEVPPIELAEAYTVFSNRGKHAKRYWVNTIRDGSNKQVYTGRATTNQAISEQVAYIVTNIMEDVISRGTAASVRARGFRLPAAGKTGTARDGWFAGFTSELVTVVWVGFDDYRDLDLEGSRSALPIWTEFMKRAHNLPQYANAKHFKAPAGLVKAEIDTSTGLLAGDSCWNVGTEYFVAGTQPKRTCEGPHYDEIFGENPTETVQMETPRRSVFGRVADIFR
jgi:penicillin-binding protein 1B